GAGGQPGSGLGINVAQHSFASISNNTIQNNRRIGILVHENSAARIGFADIALTGRGDNTIQNNGGHGILVTRGANARVVATTIRDNDGDGVRVERGASAEVAGNVISGNSGNGITVLYASAVNLDLDDGVLRPNGTEPGRPNGGVGMQCALGAVVSGSLGTLIGARGAREVDGTCVNDLAD